MQYYFMAPSRNKKLSFDQPRPYIFVGEVLSQSQRRTYSRQYRQTSELQITVSLALSI